MGWVITLTQCIGRWCPVQECATPMIGDSENPMMVIISVLFVMPLSLTFMMSIAMSQVHIHILFQL
jgi:hypothetical protein